MREETRTTRAGAHRRSPTLVPVEDGGRSDHQVLEAISEVLSRQRAAILSRDIHTMDRLFEALLALMADLSVLSSSANGQQSGRSDAGAAAIASLARRVQDQLAINHALIGSGMIVTDHYMAAVTEAAASLNRTLFSGVG